MREPLTRRLLLFGFVGFYLHPQELRAPAGSLPSGVPRAHTVEELSSQRDVIVGGSQTNVSKFGRRLVDAEVLQVSKCIRITNPPGERGSHRASLSQTGGASSETDWRAASKTALYVRLSCGTEITTTL